ncbi:RICIN domain-containing protein [Halorhabdus sp. SVX81]|uniref:RICIN domain-containing protein n=1 Tax=Halorhabdus sp. SVX81 TaxID=2978283 RepID=UPI0023DA43EB|nr:RICIN domain-containing protein [Halorhabdus sp. SVX81]
MPQNSNVDGGRNGNAERGATDTGGGRATTRRRALALAGTGLVSGLVGTALGADHDAVVYDTNGQFIAENGGQEVYAGDDYIDAIQAAVDSLTPGRRTKEKVRVDATGSTGTASGLRAVDLPSYTILDVPGSIDVNDTGEPWIIPARAENAEEVEIQRFNVTGNPRYGIRISHCDGVVIDDVTMDLSGGLGIRIDGRNGPDTTNVTLNSADINGSGTHAVETYGVDGLDIGTVRATDIATGCGLLLNDTSNATVEYVDATRCDQGGGYAGFRCANDAGPNITVDSVDATDCGRGIFTVSGSSGIEIHDVTLEGNGGNLIQDTRETVIDGGTITNTGSAGIRLDSRSSDQHPYTRNVTVRNLTIRDNAGYGVYETGPDTEGNAIVNNAFCDNGSGAIETYAGNTTVRGNTDCGGGGTGGDSGGGTGGDSGSGGDNGSDSAGPISDGTYQITNLNSGKLLEVANAETADGANIRQYGDTGHPCQHWNVTANGDGTYRLTNAHSGKLLEVANADTSDGANVRQYGDTDHPCQDWNVIDNGDGTYRLENENGGSVADVENASSEDGANVLQWPWHGGDNQRWRFNSI